MPKAVCDARLLGAEPVVIADAHEVHVLQSIICIWIGYGIGRNACAHIRSHHVMRSDVMTLQHSLPIAFQHVTLL